MVRFFLYLSACGLLMMFSDLSLHGDDQPHSGEGKTETTAEEQTPIQWSLAIHGGAGADPKTWADGKRAARLAGLEQALATGKRLLEAGTPALETVEEVIRVFEDNSHFNAGRGAVLTTDGKAELDASIMDGRTAACGAVGGTTIARNPITLARLVMTETPHVLLVGPGADQFAEQQARQNRIELVTPEYFLSRSHRRRNEEVAPAVSPPRDGDDELHFGTVGCVVRDAQGNLAAGTSTGGTKQKLPGRIGDSPIVGAGTYAANGWCAVSGTGVGEEFIRNAVAYDITAQMRYANRSLDESVTRIMQQRLKPGIGGLIAVDAEGQVVMQHNTPGMSCGTADSTGRFEVSLTVTPSGSDIE